MKISKKILINALKKDLYLDSKINILQTIMPLQQPKNKTIDLWVKCITEKEFDDYENAIAGSVNPETAKKVWQANPKPFYVIVNFNPDNNIAHAYKMSKETYKKSKDNKEKLQIIKLV